MADAAPKRFIKFIPSPEADHLRANHPWAFLLLNLIASRVRRTPSLVLGLEVSQAYVGDSKAIGATRSQYRYALKVLEKICAIQISKTHKSNQFTTNRITKNLKNNQFTTNQMTKPGTVVTLLNSVYYDVNLYDENTGCDQSTTNQRPINDHKQDREERKIDKKDPILPFLTEIENHLNRLELRDGVIFYVIEKMKQSWKSGEIKARNPAGLIKYAVTCARSRNAKIVDESVYEKEKDLRNGTSDSSSGLRDHREELTIQNRKAAKAFSEFQENGLRVIPREFFMEIVEYRDFKHNFQEFDWSSNAHYHKKQCNLSYSDPNWNEIVKDFHTENEKIVAIQ